MITTEQLEQAVLMIIKDVYDSIYYKKLKVKELINYKGELYGYQLSIDINKQERPLVICIEGDSCYFLEQVRKELIERRLADINYYGGYKIRN